MKEIIFKSNKFGKIKTKIDDVDFNRLKKLKNLKWCVVVKRNKYYFQKRLKGLILVELHRWIMKCPKGLYVDHINQDTTDNRRCNLRICTNSANLRNGRLRPNNKSGFTGVFKRYNKWGARIRVKYKTISLGYFKTKKEAIESRKKAQIKYFDI